MADGYVILDPPTQDRYKIYEKIIGSTTSGAMVHHALFIPADFQFFDHASIQELNYLPVKIISVESPENEKWIADVQRSRSVVSHRNIIDVKTSITADGNFYVVMPFMTEGSLRFIMSSWFQDGLNEECIATVLREVLIGLSHLHQQGQLHKEIEAHHIYAHEGRSEPTISLAFAGSIYEDKINQASTSASSSSMPGSISSWGAAPEVIVSNDDYTVKADIWLIGVTALELAHGRIHGRQELDAIVDRLTGPSEIRKKEEKGKGKEKKMTSFIKALIPCISPGQAKKKKFSKSFEEMVAMCLDRNPTNRPTADELLQHEFFNKAYPNIYYFWNVLVTSNKKRGTSATV
ncbi:hypothetical protein L1049_018860 [Liquidambar formosana]|uniref:Protein kinase domain-containing protein n=1 Tax=Liquidambar formosana TaxID=63359 RepID=A0AAP0WNQ9_LIQFO